MYLEQVYREHCTTHHLLTRWIHYLAKIRTFCVPERSILPGIDIPCMISCPVNRGHLLLVSDWTKELWSMWWFRIWYFSSCLEYVRYFELIDKDWRVLLSVDKFASFLRSFLIWLRSEIIFVALFLILVCYFFLRIPRIPEIKNLKSEKYTGRLSFCRKNKYCKNFTSFTISSWVSSSVPFLH